MAVDTSVRIRGDSKDAERAIDRVKKGLTGLSATARALPGFTALGAAVAGAFSAQAVSQIANTADALAKLSRRTSISIEDLSAYAYAAELSGSSIEEFGSAVDRLNRNIRDAGDGVATPAKAFEALGVSVIDSAGNLRKTDDVLREVMQAFSELPEGPERAAIAMDLFGRSGANLSSFLDLGAEGMVAVREEAERLGLVMSQELGAASEQFNDNMLRITKSIEGIKIAIGNELIPVLADVSDEFLAAQKAGLSFWEQLLLGTSTGFTEPQAALKDLKKQLADLNAERKRSINDDYLATLDKEIERVQRFIKNFEILENLRGGGSEEEIIKNKKLLELKKELSNELTKQARASSVSKKATDDQIKDAERLRDALEKAWQASVDGARKAGEEVAALLKQADQSQADYQKQADERRAQDLTPQEQQRRVVDQAETATNDAEFAGARAVVAAIEGRAEDAKNYAEQAKKLIEEAADASNRVEDNQAAAALLERLGVASADAIKAEARLKQGEQQALTERAQAQQDQISTIAEQLAALKAEASGVPVVIDGDAAKKRIAELQEAIAKLKADAAAVSVGGGAAPQTTSDAQGNASFAGGGFTGWGGKFQPAGVVHRGEYVVPQDIVRQPGVLDFLRDFHRRGLRALPGYSAGGLVTGVRVPSINPRPAAALQPMVLDFGNGFGRFDVSAPSGTAQDLSRQFRLWQLRKGAR